MNKQKFNADSQNIGGFYIGIILLSAATLLFEINLTRLYSIAQFYHFAFFVVSLALLGFGTSGTILSIFPQLAKGNISKKLQWLSISTAASILGSYLAMNIIPFDSFAIAARPNQILVLVLHYVLQSLPFFFSGLVVGIILKVFPQKVDRIYSVNLLGSSIGCILAFFIPSFIGGEGVVFLCIGIAAFSSLIYTVRDLYTFTKLKKNLAYKMGLIFLVLLFLIFSCLECKHYAQGGDSNQWFDLRISPYKALSYSLQYPDAFIVSTSWNAFSKIDIVESQALRAIPGLSYRYPEVVQTNRGLFVDSDNLGVLINPKDDLGFAEYLPQFISYQLKPHPEVLILEPYGGLDISVALAHSSQNITAVESNGLILKTIKPLYVDNNVEFIHKSIRSFLQENKDKFDIIVLSLVSNYHPVNSGAYSLTEDYRYTVEAFSDVIDHLNAGGIFVVNRWLQMPPSEWLRTYSTAITAMEKQNMDVRNCIVAFRGYNLGTLMIKKQPFTEEELRAMRSFWSDRSFDLVYSPDIQQNEINKYNLLQEPIYYKSFMDLMNTADKNGFYSANVFDVTPPVDDKPFFGNYFKWSQLPTILESYGRTWQPFGGAGFLVILVLLLITVIVSGVLILAPLFSKRLEFSHIRVKQKSLLPSVFLYFFMLGMAYMFVEIPLIQKLILFLDNPAFAFTTVLFSLLLFSGLGSRFSKVLPVKLAIILLVGYILAMPVIFSKVIGLNIGLPLSSRVPITVVMLSPMGFLMGIPFPIGLQAVGRKMPQLIPWVWGINGATSVVASVLATLFAISWGFSFVFLIGALCYFIVWLLIPRVLA